MTKTLKSSVVLVAALWVGGLFWIGFVVAPYLFILASRNSPTVPNTGVAAELIGPLLYGSDLVGLVVAAGLAIGLILLRRRNEVPLGGRVYLSEIALGVAFLCVAVNYWVFTPWVKSVKAQIAEAYGAFHLADKTDRLYQSFTGLHQTSTVLFTVAFAAGLLCLLCMTQFRSRVSDVQGVSV